MISASNSRLLDLTWPGGWHVLHFAVRAVTVLRLSHQGSLAVNLHATNGEPAGRQKSAGQRPPQFESAIHSFSLLTVRVVQAPTMKYVVVSGGVVSGLGKGVTISSVGRMLQGCGLRVTSIKIDPYLNVDAGTMSPFEHGEVRWSGCAVVPVWLLAVVSTLGNDGLYYHQ